jgi:hypothetical protein
MVERECIDDDPAALDLFQGVASIAAESKSPACSPRSESRFDNAIEARLWTST